LIFWLTPDMTLYHVRELSSVYGFQFHACYICGNVHSYNRFHKCNKNETIKQNSRKRKIHYKCSEKELERKRNRFDPSLVEEGNCLGASLRQAMKEWGVIKKEDQGSLKEWYCEMKMDETWNQPSNLLTVKQWAERLNEKYKEDESIPFEIIVYDQSLRQTLARYGNGSRPIFLNLTNDHFTWI